MLLKSVRSRRGTNFKPAVHTLQIFWLKKIIVVKLNKSIIYKKYEQYFFPIFSLLFVVSHIYRYILRVCCLKNASMFSQRIIYKPSWRIKSASRCFPFFCTKQIYTAWLSKIQTSRWFLISSHATAKSRKQNNSTKMANLFDFFFSLTILVPALYIFFLILIS